MSIRPRRALWSAAVGASVTAALFVLVPATPAAAADELQLSLDGVHWSSALPGGIFDPSVQLVPGSRLTGTFYARNNSSDPAWLRAGISQLVVSDMELAVSVNVTTISTTASGASGSTARLDSAGIVCSDLVGSSQTIPPNGVARIDSSMWFRPEVPDVVAQNGIAQLSFMVELTSADQPAPSGPLCTGALVVDPDLEPGDYPYFGGPGSSAPTGPGAGGSGTGSSGGAGAGGGADVGDRVIASPVTGSIGGGIIGVGDGSRPYVGAESDLPFNTVQWWEEYAIMVLIGAALVGAVARFYAYRRWESSDRAGGR